MEGKDNQGLLHQIYFGLLVLQAFTILTLTLSGVKNVLVRIHGLLDVTQGQYWTQLECGGIYCQVICLIPCTYCAKVRWLDKRLLRNSLDLAIYIAFRASKKRKSLLSIEFLLQSFFYFDFRCILDKSNRNKCLYPPISIFHSPSCICACPNQNRNATVIVKSVI